MTKRRMAEQILNDLVAYGCTDFPYEMYEERKQEAVSIILESLEDYILIQGEVIE